MTGDEIFKALAGLLEKARFHQIEIESFRLHPETIHELIKSSEGWRVDVFLGLQQRDTRLFGIPVYSRSEVRPGYVSLYPGQEDTFHVDLREYLPVRPWWLRLDTTV